MWTTILKIVSTALGFIREWLADLEAERNRQAGRDEANAETLRRNAERAAQGREIEAQAEKDHRSNPDSDAGFDTSFRRD